MTPRRLAIFGSIGPALFVAIVIIVTALEWDFLHRMGWGLLRGTRPVVYPSATAMGPYGWLQTLNFLQAGLAVIATTIGIWKIVRPRPRIGAALLFLVGVAVTMSTFTTDGTNQPPFSPGTTWHGSIHALAFVLLLFSSLLGSLVLAFQLRSNAEWRGVGLASLAVPIVTIGLQFLGGPFQQATGLLSDLGLLVVIAWLELLGLRLLTFTAHPTAP